MTKAADAFTGESTSPLTPGVRVDAATVDPADATLTPSFQSVSGAEYDSTTRFTVERDAAGLAAWEQLHFASSPAIAPTGEAPALLLAVELAAKWVDPPNLPTRLRAFNGNPRRVVPNMFFEVPMRGTTIKGIAIAELPMSDGLAFDVFSLGSEPCRTLDIVHTRIARGAPFDAFVGTLEIPKFTIRTVMMRLPAPIRGGRAHVAAIHIQHGKLLRLTRFRTSTQVTIDETGAAAKSTFTGDIPLGHTRMRFKFNTPFGFILRRPGGATLFEGVYY